MSEENTLKGIRARLREIAPDPGAESADVAEALARNMTVSALRRNSRCLNSALSPDQALSIEALSALCYQFAAVHLLQAFRAEEGPERANLIAAEILSAWDDGGGIGEWLWEHAQKLGVDADEVNRLADAEARLEAAPKADL